MKTRHGHGLTFFALLALLALSACASPPGNPDRPTPADSPTADNLVATDQPLADQPATDVPATDVPAVDTPAPDAPPMDAAVDAPPPVDVPATDAPRPDGGPPGELFARIVASREVVREAAAGAPASDSESALSAVTSPGVVSWRWRVLDAETDAVALDVTTPTAVYACPTGGRGAYDVELTVSNGVATGTWRQRRLVTCTLPRVAAGRTVHEVDLAAGSYFQNGMVAGRAVAAGDVIRVRGAIRSNWAFFNLAGTAARPIHIINNGLVVNENVNSLLHLVNCRYVIVDGMGDDANAYGIVLRNRTGTGAQGVFIRNFTQGANVSQGSTGIEVFGVHIDGNAGTGVEVNTHGTAEFNRANWRFEDLRLHHIRVEDAENEGFYVGYTRDWVGSAETHTAYQIHDARIYRNTLLRSGNDGLQLCNSQSLEAHDNVVDGAGLAGSSGHTSALQYNSGCSGAVYNNELRGGSGSNVHAGCTGGTTYFFNNVFDRDPARGGSSVVYINAGRTSGVHYYFFQNTFRTRTSHGISLNADSPDCNTTDPVDLDGLYIANNVFVFPDGTIGGDPPAAFRWDTRMLVSPVFTTTPNVTRRESEIASLCFSDAAAGAYDPACATSPALAGTGAALTSLPGLSAASLPLGAFSDFRARVLADPRNYGAFQTIRP